MAESCFEMRFAHGRTVLAKGALKRRLTANRLCQARQTAGIPQQELADRLALPVRRLSRYERGLDPIPARLLGAVAIALDLSTEPRQPEPASRAAGGRHARHSTERASRSDAASSTADGKSGG
jgi:transcriptional regulator with XRE-family HTH domain